MGKNYKKKAEDRREINKQEGFSSLPSSGLAEDILGSNFSSQKVTTKGMEIGIESGNRAFHNDGMMKFVTFFLEGEEYALPISQVQEIMRVGEITRVPNSPDHVKGVMNLRGRIIPVIELKKRLNIGEAVIDMNSRIVVVENGLKVLGLMVDKVAQVMNITADQIDKAPEEVVQVQENYIKGVGKTDERMVILLDLDQIIGKEVEA